MNFADAINQQNEVSYFVNQPVSIFRTYNVGLEQSNMWNFNGTYLGSGGHLSFSSEFTNQWSFGINLIYESQSLDTKILRGGYDMIMPRKIMSFGSLATDQAKKITVKLEYSLEKSGDNSASVYQLMPGITYRPISNLKIGFTANYMKNINELQYVDTKDYLTEKRYILGSIDQKTLGLTFRVDLNITPEFSIQYYGSPFVSRGSYSEFKRVTDPKADSYNNRFSVFDNPQLIDNNYQLDENNDNITDYTIENPDFNFHEFRSNFVAKWEYRLGSFIYFVWSSEKTGNTGSSNASIGDSYKELRGIYPNNIFLIKLSYWFSL
jgi:hypothetical protein